MLATTVVPHLTVESWPRFVACLAEWTTGSAASFLTFLPWTRLDEDQSEVSGSCGC